ncbi:MAG: hypothetical protein OEV78_07780 [Spirochaetia bacterium]|nr:hypothetical protein [Spirochaetia bacterium]
MNWKRKGKSAWALIIPNVSEYEFLPLSKVLGNHAVEILFNLNLKWQKEIFTFIKKNLPAKVNPDFFIFLQIENNDLKKYIKVQVKKELDPFKIKLRASIPEPPKTLNTKEKKINDALKEMIYPKNSTAGKMKNIFEHLLKKYNRVTVWNLESLVLAPEHFSQISSANSPAGTLFSLTSPHNRLVLLSYNFESIDDMQKMKIKKNTIPAIYDLKSLQEIIYNFSTMNTTLSQKRTEELSTAIQTIHQNLP